MNTQTSPQRRYPAGPSAGYRGGYSHSGYSGPTRGGRGGYSDRQSYQGSGYPSRGGAGFTQGAGYGKRPLQSSYEDSSAQEQRQQYGGPRPAAYRFGPAGNIVSSARPGAARIYDEDEEDYYSRREEAPARQSAPITERGRSLRSAGNGVAKPPAERSAQR